jgi:hypothetical protein
MTCTTQNAKNYTKILVINAAKSLTNISKGVSNKQYLTPINIRPIVTIHWEWLHHWSRVIGSKAPTHAHIDHKANPYSKPMAIIIARTGVPCLTMQLVLLVFYMHSFTSLIIILLTDTRLLKREFPVVPKCIS